MLYTSFCASVSATFASTGVSNVSGLSGAWPLIVWHGKYGPGLEFRYQLSQFGTGGDRPAGAVVFSTVRVEVVQALDVGVPFQSHGVCVESGTVQPLTMCASLSGTAAVPT